MAPRSTGTLQALHEKTVSEVVQIAKGNITSLAEVYRKTKTNRNQARAKKKRLQGAPLTEQQSAVIDAEYDQKYLLAVNSMLDVFIKRLSEYKAMCDARATEKKMEMLCNVLDEADENSELGKRRRGAEGASTHVPAPTPQVTAGHLGVAHGHLGVAHGHLGVAHGHRWVTGGHRGVAGDLVAHDSGTPSRSANRVTEESPISLTTLADDEEEEEEGEYTPDMLGLITPSRLQSLVKDF
jgi:hypothetical protein